MKVHYPKLYKMAHFLALNVLLLPKDLTITFTKGVQKVHGKVPSYSYFVNQLN